MEKKMQEFRATGRYAVAVPTLLTVIFAVASCSKASETSLSTINPTYTTPGGWNTICLDRFLIDLPGNIEMGAAKARYDDTYGLAGIFDIGGKGLRWGKVSVSETVPTDAAGFDAIRIGVPAISTTPAQYKAAVKDREAEIESWIKRTKSGTPREIATAKRIADKEKKELDAGQHSFKVSGEAKLLEDRAFAIRRGNEFFIGYLDEFDHRVRNFSGELSHPQFESPRAAAEEYQRLRRTYHPRLIADIPAAPGYCTGFGLIDEPDHPEIDTELEMPFRIKNYPNLIFTLTLAPADPDSPRDIQKLPGMDARNAKLDLIGIKGRYGPIRENILGTPGRSYGQEYGPNCSATSCRPADQAYDIEAETFGVPGRVDLPHLILHMTAATSDDYKLKYPFIPNNPTFNKPDRPGLSGHVPPPFKEGQKIFEQVLRSIRLRPGAIAAPSAAVPPLASAQAAHASKK